MKRISTPTTALAVLAGWLFMMPLGVSLAADTAMPRGGDQGAAGEAAASNLRSGSFDGYDSKAGLVWVNDKVFELSDGLKVIGTAKKAGVLSDIRQGEPVTILYGEAGRKGIPVAIEIRRQ